MKLSEKVGIGKGRVGTIHELPLQIHKIFLLIGILELGTKFKLRLEKNNYVD